ncbi:MAG: endonuclease/exonuclease/phosphatase family protein [Dermatophilaceae bacterium]
MNRRAARRRRTLLVRWAVALVAFVSLIVATPSTASAGGVRPDDPQLTVMTRNLYLGASLTPALAATDTTSFLKAVAEIYRTAQFTDFPTRAQAVADEIASNRPDLVALQEVSEWVTSGPGVPPTLDFLTVLTSALSAKGLHYSVAARSDNADIGPVPLVAPCDSTVVGACLVTLKDRDVILVNNDRKGLSWSNPQSGTYTTQQSFTPPVPGAAPVSFQRGWVTIDGSLRWRPFHFANTHLETEDFPAVQQAQAAEFLAGPAQGRGADIAAGDFNSAADGTTTTSYQQLTAVFSDAWRVNWGRPGLSCCQNETLTNPVSQLSSRIDLVLSRHGARARWAKLVGNVPFREPLPPPAARPVWASDHAGVVAGLVLDN